MHELVYTAEIAGHAMPGAPDFGPYSILQLFGGIITLMMFALGALAWMRGEQRGSGLVSGPAPAAAAAPSDKPAADSGVHLYFDGPLKAIFDRLDRILSMLESHGALHYGTRETIAQALQSTRHDIKGAIHEAGQGTEREIAELEDLVRGLKELVVRLDEFMRNVSKRGH